MRKQHLRKKQSRNQKWYEKVNDGVIRWCIELNFMRLEREVLYEKLSHKLQNENIFDDAVLFMETRTEGRLSM